LLQGDRHPRRRRAAGSGRQQPVEERAVAREGEPEVSVETSHTPFPTATARRPRRMRMSRGRAAAAGAVGTLVWAAVEPLDRRLLKHDYSDVAVLGKAVTRSSHWRSAGIAAHALNGAVFGLAYAELNRRRHVSGVRLALAEH